MAALGDKDRPVRRGRRRGHSVLVRNHEVNGPVGAFGAQLRHLRGACRWAGPSRADPHRHHDQSHRDTGHLRGRRPGQLLRGLTKHGEILDTAVNNIANRTDDEFAGATFSPDHETLYCNIQASSGLTFAIWGPWEGRLLTAPRPL